MDVEKVFEDIQGLHKLNYLLSKKDKVASKELNRLHKLVYGESIDFGCGNCRIKAFHKLTSLTLEFLNQMENQNFKIKKGVLVEFPYGSGTFYNNLSGIPDDKAVQYLSALPHRISNFDVYPGHDSKSGELNLSLLAPKAVEEEEKKDADLSKMNKVQLQAKYKEAIGSDADDSLTKKELISAIDKKD